MKNCIHKKWLPKTTAFLFLLFYSTLFAQSDSVGFKTVAYDVGVKSYAIQSTPDTTKGWNTISTIQPAQKKDSNLYASPITIANIFYRVSATMLNGYVYNTKPLQYLSTLAVDIINVILQSNTDYLTLYFTSENESNINYYEIDQSLDGGDTMADILHIPPKGNSDYSVTINRPTTQVTSCGAKIFGWCLWKHLKTVVDSRKEILYIYLISKDGTRTLLKAIGE